jgi:prepilin-type N-terminal cleavage/methylation domain-containing protein
MKLSKHDRKGSSRYEAFSLLEMLIVIVIVATLAAIAISRMSRGSSGAAESALVTDLEVLRKAIDLFAAEHHGTYPSVSNIADQFTQYTDIFGDAQPSKDATHIYGPYLQKIPPLTVGPRKGCAGIAAADAAGVGWIYNEKKGTIRANTTLEKALSGILYRYF